MALRFYALTWTVALLLSSPVGAAPAGTAPTERVSSYLKKASDEAASIAAPLERHTTLLQLGSLRHRVGDVSGAEAIAAEVSSKFGFAAGFRVFVEQRVRAGDVEGALVLSRKVEDQNQRDSILYYVVYSLAVSGDVKAARYVERMIVGNLLKPMAAEVVRGAEVMTRPEAAEAIRAEGTAVTRSRVFWYAAKLSLERGDLKLARAFAEQIEIPAGKAEVLSWILRALEDAGELEAAPVAGAVRESAKMKLPPESGQWGEVTRVIAFLSVARFEATSGLAEKAQQTFVEAERLARDFEGRDDPGPQAQAERSLMVTALAVPRAEVLLALDREEEAIRHALKEEVAPLSPYCFAAIAKWQARQGRYDAVEKLTGRTATAEQRSHIRLGAAEGFLTREKEGRKPAVDKKP